MVLLASVLNSICSAPGPIYRTAVHTRQHEIKYLDVPSPNRTSPSSVQILPRHLPVMLMFRSSSTRLSMRQVHEAGNGTLKETRELEKQEPGLHLLTEPLIQEGNQLISPVKRIVQPKEMQTQVQQQGRSMIEDYEDKQTPTPQVTQAPHIDSEQPELRELGDLDWSLHTESNSSSLETSDHIESV